MKETRRKRWVDSVFTVLLSFMMVWTMIPGLFLSSTAYAATGDTPAHTKNLTDNHDGTYTISLDVVGDSEKKPNNVNVIVIADTSGSMSQQRMTAAKNAINSLANSLYAYNTQSEPDTVEMALVRFATSSSVAQQPTNSASTFRTAVNGLGNQGNGGTNWESALQTANGVDFGDNDQTFAVFVSDGNPTFRTTQNGWNDWSNTYQQWGSGQETATNIQRCYTTAVDDAQALATKVTPGNFFTIGAFGNVDRMEQLTDDAGSNSSTNYYSASDTAALNQAIADILAKIEMAGIANTEIDDGTTNQVTTTSGKVAELLEVDESSYKYYRSGGTYGTMQPWADAPEAELVNGTVEWDLSSVGVLENGVRYTVTFDCYPSQYTYDTIAKLKNGDITYNSLDSEVKKYIVDNGGGNYSLRTNTNASLSWDDTRDDEGQQKDSYVNPDPVATTAETLTATKEWEGGNPDTDSLKMTVLMDDEPFHTDDMTAATGWSTSSFISVGIIKKGQVLSGAEGHDFKFAELDDTQYHWELETPTVHPMLVNGTLTMLVKVDEDHPAPAGAETYTIKGATYYADTDAAGLTAVNHRRSNLNLTKIVTGEDAPKDAKFPFALTVNNSKKPASAPSDADDPKHESDWWVWLSIRDENGQGVTGLNLGTGVVEDSGGYYYAPSGTTFNAEIGAGWSLRFLNLPSGSTYTFAETLAAGFAFTKSELTAGTDSTFKPGQTTTGTIENTKTSYSVAFTNDYQLTDLEVKKVWDDADNQDGIRLTPEELAEKLSLSPAVQGKTPTVTENADGTYKITYTGLPRYSNGQEVEYTVTESAIDGYSTTGSPAKDHGTITNTHEPEVTSVTVVKVWDDSNNIGKIRPASINAQLTADGKASGNPVALNEGNKWTYTWEDLPKYKDGEEIEYTADETAVPSGYDKTGPEKEVAEDGTITFTVTNTYNPTPVSVDPPVQKVITGKDDLYNKGDFTFTIAAVTPQDAPMPENTSITNSAEYELEDKTGYYEFGPIEFTMPGTYTYKVTESGSVDGVTNDPAAAEGKTLTFTVTDDGTGKLVVDPTKDQVQMSFTNVYNANGEASIVVSKEITGAAWPAGKSLTLTIAGANGAPMPEATTATLDASGSVTFGPIAYKLSDAGKTYEYTITESSFGAGWSGSPASITAKVAVTDDGKGKLNTAVTYTPEDATFTNTYKASGKATLEATKAIKGAPWPAGKTLTMTLTGTENAPMPAKGGETVTLREAGKATFGDITYTEADAGKTYTYTISEDGFGAGWTGSGDVTATVVVTDNGDGTLKTEVTYSPEDATITNTYEAAGEAVIEVTKELEGAAWPAGKTLTFTLAPKTEGAPMPDSTTVDLTAAGNATFDAIAYDESDVGKTYEYSVTESSFGAGWTGAPAEITATVKVADKGDGTLTTTVTYSPEDATFTNTYKATGKATLEATKAIEGTAWPEGKTITFTLAGEGGKLPETKTVELSAPGKATFGDITYTEADAGKTYTYTISEDGFGKGWTGSGDVTATVKVTDNGDGTLKTEVTYSPEDATITNTYEAAGEAVIEVTKELEGAAWPAGKTLTFTLAPKTEGAPMPDNTTVDLTAKGKATFDAIAYDESDAGKTYEYTVTENSFGSGWTGAPEEITAKVTVTDNGDGTLKTSVAYTPENATFTNTYDANGEITLGAKKVFEAEGRELKEGEFSFTVYDAAGEPVATAANKADGTVEFSKISYKLADAGKTFNYTIKENIPDGADKDHKVGNIIYDATEYPVNVTVKDDGEGNLIATADKTAAEIVFTNKYVPDATPATISIKKTLDGRAINEGEFSFKLVPKGAVKGDPVPAEGLTAAVKADGTADISRVFTRADTYTYTLTEVVPDPKLGGVTYDTTSHDIEVKVVDNNGKLEATVTPNAVEFKNKYETKGDAKIDIEKVYEGKNWTDEEFTFDLYDSAGVKIDSKTLNKDAQTGTFEIKDLTPGTYKYKLKEVVPGSESTSEEQAPATEQTETPASEEGKAEAPAAEETQTETPAAEEAQEETPAAEEAQEETPAAEEAKAEAPAAEVVEETQSGSILERVLYIAYAAEEEAAAADSAAAEEGTVETENGKIKYDTNEYEVSIEVTDNGDGTSTAVVTYPSGEKVTFTNQYEPNPATVNPEATKTLTGKDLTEGMFLFRLTGNGEDIVVANDAQGKVTFPQLSYTAKDAGKTYEYTVSEIEEELGGVTYDTTKYTFTVSVEYDADAGKLTATMNNAEGMEFINTYKPAEVTVNLKAHKTLEGADLTKGEFAFVVESADGEVVASATNNADGSVNFGGITFAEEGTYNYTIREVNTEVENFEYDDSVYNVTITVTDDKNGKLVADVSIEGGSAEFINTYIPPEEEETPPPTPGAKTGDDNNIGGWLGLMALAAAGASGLYIRRRREDQE